jgi:predicted ATPase
MIEQIEIENFKSIKSKFFSLRRLNVLLGLNGQGKSSFLQTILLLRQSDKLFDGELNLAGRRHGLVNLGTNADVLYQYGKSDDMSISIQFSGQEESARLGFDYEAESDVLSMDDKSDGNSLRAWRSEALFSNKFQYLNAQRKEPSFINDASYSMVMTDDSQGKHGEFTAHYLELRGAEAIPFQNLLHPDSISIDPITKKRLINDQLLNQVNFWLREISPGVSVSTGMIGSDFVQLEYEFAQPNLGRTNKFRPENVGFGISYALHVVTALLSAKEGSMVIIENPESHIHPRGQAELGKLIALVALNDVQIFIETHSDHLLNGMRVAVKENPELADEVVLFYFKKIVEANEQYSGVTNIFIDKNGTLSRSPENLLSEWSNQLSQLL